MLEPWVQKNYCDVVR